MFRCNAGSGKGEGRMMVSEMTGMVLPEQTASRAWEGSGSRSCCTVVESE